MANKKKAVKPVAADSQETQAVKKGFENHLIITKSDDPRARWYVVHTYSGHEARVMASLRQRVETMHLSDRILEILIPTQEQIQIRAGKKHQVTEKIFPGYILVRMILDDNSWLTVRTTQGVTGFVGVGNKPTPISDEEVTTIQKFMSLEAPKYRAKFSVSEAVKIIDGPFSEFLGSIESIDEERGKVRVLVSIFGRETPVELDFLQVKKL
ncbi:MAG TPA: transcription termination/antitermination protein NusG [Patescibacteria group bacterium]|nr:transcription termination/antitermination protein NusG [Patescibacteria group bacterium]